jgi:hypothetical protein
MALVTPRFWDDKYRGSFAREHTFMGDGMVENTAIGATSKLNC